MTVKSYNPETVYLTLSWVADLFSSPETASLENWESVSISFTDDRYEFTTSTSGHIVKSKILNKLGSIEIVAIQGSDTVAKLSKLINSNKKINIELVEKNAGEDATIYTLNDGAITDAGSGERGRTAGERTFVITGEVKLEEKTYID